MSYLSWPGLSWTSPAMTQRDGLFAILIWRKRSLRRGIRPLSR